MLTDPFVSILGAWDEEKLDSAVLARELARACPGQASPLRPNDRDRFELRAQQNLRRSIQLCDGVVIGNSSSKQKGISARVIRNGSCGFAATSEYHPDSVCQTLLRAFRHADFLAGKAARDCAPYPPLEPRQANFGQEMRQTVAQRELLEYVRILDQFMATHFRDLLSRRISISLISSEKIVRTSDSVRAHTYLPRVTLVAGMTMRDNEGKPVSHDDIFGGSYGGFTQALPADPADLFPELEETYRLLKDKAQGVYPSAGLRTVVMAAEVAGILAHEAIGHTVEADNVRLGSVAGPALGQMVASPAVTLVDFANTAFGRSCPVPVFVDDEGVTATDAVLIENGVLRSFMHNRETAQLFGQPACGNARASDFADEPLIRMRNTCILPGKHSLSEMIASVDDGYYLLRSGNGQADTTGEFMFGITCGYEIKKGRLARPLKETTISGMAFDVLRSVDLVSHDLTWLNGGYCGKKQMITVGMGGPALRAQVHIGGR